VYEGVFAKRPMSEPPRLFERNPVPTLVLHGPDDHVIWPDFAERCEVVFTDLVGPFVVPRAGHFLQWERAELLNKTLASFLRDRLG
jgi:pimeloyl-ACP methyl ester carboxylesterase